MSVDIPRDSVLLQSGSVGSPPPEVASGAFSTTPPGPINDSTTVGSTAVRHTAPTKRLPSLPKGAQGISIAAQGPLAAAALGHAVSDAAEAAVEVCVESRSDLSRMGKHTISLGGVFSWLKGVREAVRGFFTGADTSRLESDEGVELIGVGKEGAAKPLGDKDRKLGLSRTRNVTTFTETFDVGKQKATMTLEVVATRDENKRFVEERIRLIQEKLKEVGITPERVLELNAQLKSCEAQLVTLRRDSPSAHSTFAREVLREGHVFDRAVGEVPDLTVRTLTLDGKSTTSVQFGALGDQRNTKTSLKQLSLIVEGWALSPGLEEEKKRLEQELGVGEKELLGEWLAADRSKLKDVQGQLGALSPAAKDRTPLEIEQAKLESQIATHQPRLDYLNRISHDIEAIQLKLDSFDEAEKELVSTKRELETEKASLENKIDKLPKKGEGGEELERANARLAVIAHMLRDLEDPEQALAERRELLLSQMIAPLQRQVQRAAKDGIGAEIHMSHTLLLQLEKDSVDKKSQLSHDEYYLIEDTEQIFKEMDGRTIIFDALGSPPWIELDEPGVKGAIHLPAPENVRPGQKTILQTHFGNVVVQTNKSLKKESVEKLTQLNQKLFEDIKSGLREKIKKLEEKVSDTKDDETMLIHLRETLVSVTKAEESIKKGEASFDNATIVDEACCLLGWQTSKGCYSNKDRGGFTGRKGALEEKIHEKEAEVQYYEHRDKDDVLDRDEKLKDLRREIHDLRYQVWRAVEHDSCEMQFVEWTTPSGQRTLKTWIDYETFPSAKEFFENAAKMVLDKAVLD